MVSKLPETEGQFQTYLEAALEHFSATWGALHRSGLRTPKSNPPDPKDFITDDMNDPRYALAAAHSYVWEVWQGMAKQWGSTDGQLCPYEDCCHDLAVPKSGWYACGHCLKPIYFKSSDGVEDYHAYKPGEIKQMPEPPQYLPMARDLGPSYGTPDKR